MNDLYKKGEIIRSLATGACYLILNFDDDGELFGGIHVLTLSKGWGLDWKWGIGECHKINLNGPYQTVRSRRDKK